MGISIEPFGFDGGELALRVRISPFGVGAFILAKICLPRYS